MPSSTSPRAWPDARRTLALWAGLLAGPFVWAVVLELDYVLSYVACESSPTWHLHAANLGGAALVALAASAAWRAGPPADEDRRTAPVGPVTREIRARWMSVGGLVVSLWFVLVILAMEIPTSVLPPCTGR